MENLSCNCPHCGVQLNFSEQMLGESHKCGNCLKPVKFPGRKFPKVLVFVLSAISFVLTLFVIYFAIFKAEKIETIEVVKEVEVEKEVTKDKTFKYNEQTLQHDRKLFETFEIE